MALARSTLAAAILGLGVAAATAALVEWEGRRYRQSPAVRGHQRDAARRVAGWERPVAPTIGTAAIATPPAPPSRPLGPVAVAGPETLPGVKDADEVLAVPAEPPTPPVPTPPVPTAAPKPPRPTFETRRPAAELSPAEQDELGHMLHAIILYEHDLLPESPLLERVQKAAAPLLQGPERPEPRPRFFILDSDGINVFSHIGGFVYLDRGLFAMIADDVDLQFVLARELAHLRQRHAARAIDRQRGAATEMDDLVPWAYHQIALGYDPADEFEADAQAHAQLLALGRTRRESLGYLRRLVSYAARQGAEGGRSRPRTGREAAVQDIANHWRSAPAAADRLQRVQAAARQ